MRFPIAMHAVQQSMEQARQRVAERGTAGVRELMVLGFAVLLLGIAVALWTKDHQAGFHGLQGLTHAFLPDVAWAMVTRFGDERVLFVLALLFVRHRPEIFWAMLVAALIGTLYSHGLKLYLDVLRPPAVLSSEEFRLIGPALRRNSFPSGHTLSAFLFAGVLFAFSTSVTQRLALLLAATFVGLSRVAVGVHWPQDIIAGAFSGLLLSAAGVWITCYWQAGLRPRVHLWLLLLPFAAMLLLLADDNGNPSTPLFVYPVVALALAKGIHDYRDIFATQ
ncbi:MAG: phosphatase PAP2 family protein [Sedimenticolaceae bacterium]